jgi:hypothetical protein
MKKYLVVIKKGSDKEKMKRDMESVSSLDFVPERQCNVEDLTHTRCFYSLLSEEEARTLAMDSRVKEVKNLAPMFMTSMGCPTGLGMSVSFKDEIVEVDGKPTVKRFFFTEPSSNPTVIPGSNQFINLGMRTNETRESVSEEESTKVELRSQGAVSQVYVENLPDGEGVDVVIVDGIICGLDQVNVVCTPAPYVCGRAYSCIQQSGTVHPELRDSEGNSRVELVNWNSYAGVSGEYPYGNLLGFQSNDERHGLHVSGIACGLTNGWARKSKIFNISPYYYGYGENPLVDSGDFKYLTAIKNWHLSKGNSRPTVTNHSYGLQYPPMDVRHVLSITVDGVTQNAPRNDGGAVVEAVIGQNGQISSFNVINGGSGYTNPPDISFNGGGGDEAVLIMADGSVKEIIVTNSGSGYDPTSPPSITFSASPVSGGTAEGTCEVDENGRVSWINVTKRGNGYASPPTVTFASPVSGTTAEATASVGSNFITRIQMVSEVNPLFRASNLPGYDPPMLIISGGGCVKNALWRLSRDPEIIGAWYAGVLTAVEPGWSHTGKVLRDGIYCIVEKKTDISPTSFKQTLLGGEYSGTPSVSFKYYLRANIGLPGPYGKTKIEGGQITQVTPFWADDYAQFFTGFGWFTSPPQVFITNGGGFTPSQLNDMGMILYGADSEPWNESWGDNVPINIPVYFVSVPSRNPVMDSLLEDLVESGVVVVAAAGNSSQRTIREGGPGYETTFSVNFCYLDKENPDIPFEDSIPFPFDSMGPLGEYYLGYVGPLPILDWGDNLYDIDVYKGSSPGASPGAISVGSFSWECCPERKASYSNSGTRIDLYAAGDEVISCSYSNGTCSGPATPYPGDNLFGMIKYSGTSMASPQVCGAAACYLTKGYSARTQGVSVPEEVTNWVLENAVSSLADLPYPNDLKGGTDKQLYFPGVTVRD